MPYKVDGAVVQSAPIPISVGKMNAEGLLGALGNRVRLMKIPFVKSTSERDTGVDLPNNALVHDVFVEVTTAVSGATINVGLLSSETGGVSDGFLKGASCSSAGVVFPVLTSTTSGGQTLGSYLKATEIKSADTTAIYLAVRKIHYAGSVTAKRVSYTTSDHTIAGNIYILYSEMDNTTIAV